MKNSLIKKGLAFLGMIMLFVITAKAQSAYIDRYITESVTLTTIGSGTQSLNKPRDLDFKPNSNELWVANNGDSYGGSMVIFFDAGLTTQTSQYRKDSHTDHFKAYPSAIAFGEDGFFANTNEIKSTGGPSSTFMGPALWSSDTAIFARVFQNDWVTGLPLGSHYDMLHQSPFAMGIAHDSALIYWVNDGHNGNICKYDYVKHHGPGYDNHSAGKIWRYSDVGVTRVTNVPSHMVMDKATGWLYYIDGGNKKLKRLFTRSGTIIGNLSAPASGAEPLAGYWNVAGATVEELDTYVTQPCGIDFLDNRLIVSDYTTGNIYLYTVGAAVTLVKTIVTGHPHMMGVKFGPDSRIWCVNNTENNLYRLDIGTPLTDAALISINAPLTQNFMPDFYYTGNNVCNTSITPAITLLNKGTSAITSIDFQYTIDGASPLSFTWTGSIASGNTGNVTLPLTAVSGGEHLMTIKAVSVNGSIDDVVQNNSIAGSFRVVSASASTASNFTEDFSSPAFPPPGWNYIGYNPNNVMSRVASGGFGNSTGCLKMDNFSGVEDITGQIDYLMSPSIDFSTAAPASLQFSLAYAQYSAQTKDKLDVWVSTDCGATWANVYSKEGANLATTATFATSSWTPTAAQWRNEIISLSAYAGQPKVIVMFATTNNFGNNLYLDDIKMDNTVGISDISDEEDLFKVYPNPSDGIIDLSITRRAGSTDLTGRIYAYDGKRVQTFSIAGSEKKKRIDLKNLPPGIYAIQLSDGKTIVTKSIIKK